MTDRRTHGSADSPRTFREPGRFDYPGLPDHDAQATTLTWQRVLDFRRTVSG